MEINTLLQRPLYPYQVEGVQRGMHFGSYINGDEPGLGKTSQAIADVVASNAWPCIVICPSTLKVNWRNEFSIVAGVDALVLTDKYINSWPQYFEAGYYKVFITNYESVRKFFVQSAKKQHGGKLIDKDIMYRAEMANIQSCIIDELHRCREPKTQVSKLVNGLTNGIPKVIGLTGTPIVNKANDLIQQLSIINQLDAFGGAGVFKMNYTGANGDLELLSYDLKARCFFQRYKKDVLQDLPEKTRQILKCEIDNMEEYKVAQDDLVKYLKLYKNKTDREINKSLEGEVMVRIQACKNVSARGKLATLYEYIDEVIEACQKIVVFVHQKEVAQPILVRYKHCACSVRGDDNHDARNRAVSNFQTNPAYKVIVCSIKAAGVGITLTASSRMIMAELPWHSADSDQCEDRIHRIGQKNAALITYPLATGTIDHHIYNIIQNKREIANTALGKVDSTNIELIDNLSKLLEIA